MSMKLDNLIICHFKICLLVLMHFDMLYLHRKNDLRVLSDYTGKIFDDILISGQFIFYNPKSSLIRTTLIRPLGNDFSVIVHVLQIRSGLLQSMQ